MVTRAEIDDEWIRVHREALKNYGQPARASPDYNTIEVKSLRDNKWWRIELPNKQAEFVSAEVRDEVLELLVGKSRVLAEGRTELDRPPPDTLLQTG